MSDHDNDKTHAKLETPNKEQDRAEKKAHHEAKGGMQGFTEAQTKNHREQMRKRQDGADTSSGTSKLLGTPEIPGLIKGKAPESDKQHKPEHKDSTHQKQEKLEPKDKQEIGLKELLSDYKTPFSDAYNRSRQLKGEQGKSPTLESLVDRLKACPWSDKIRIKFDSSATNPQYDDFKSTITINPTDPPWKQIDNFAHESFHATNQGLRDLYLNGPVTDKNKYVDILQKLETGSFSAEIGVHNEISRSMTGAEPVSYKWSDKTGAPQPAKDLGELLASQGKEALKSFVIDEAFTRMKINGHTELSTYRHYYESTHKTYLAGFAQSAKQLQDWFKQDPNIKSKIEGGGY